MKQEFDRCYFEAFILVLLGTFLPFKALGFVVPFIFISWILIRSKSGVLFKKAFLLASAFMLILLIHSLLNVLSYHDFYISNSFVSFISYSSFLVLLLLPKDITSERYGYEKYAKVLLIVLFIEGSIGIGQKILAGLTGVGSGDIVAGTINPLSIITGSDGFSNQFFAINMSFLLLFCFPYVLVNKKGVIPMLIALLALLLASVGHVFISLVLAVFFTFLVMEGFTLLTNIKRLLLFLTFPAIMILLLMQLDNAVYEGASRQADMFFSGNTPKSQALKVVFNDVSDRYPYIHLIGLGPGQYSSRSGIISSGSYGSISALFGSMPFLEIGMTEAFGKHVLPVWNEVNSNTKAYGNSTMYRPFFSLLSVYAEFGGIFFLILLVFIIVQLRMAKKAYHKARKNKDKKAMMLSCTFTASLIFLFIIGFYENYFETAQGIFIGVLLMMMLKRILISGRDAGLLIKDETQKAVMVLG